jgi:hypothetical protein
MKKFNNKKKIATLILAIIIAISTIIYLQYPSNPTKEKQAIFNDPYIKNLPIHYTDDFITKYDSVEKKFLHSLRAKEQINILLKELEERKEAENIYKILPPSFQALTLFIYSSSTDSKISANDLNDVALFSVEIVESIVRYKAFQDLNDNDVKKYSQYSIDLFPHEYAEYIIYMSPTTKTIFSKKFMTKLQHIEKNMMVEMKRFYKKRIGEEQKRIEQAEEDRKKTLLLIRD